jgi:hypothetical protein
LNKQDHAEVFSALKLCSLDPLRVVLADIASQRFIATLMM